MKMQKILMLFLISCLGMNVSVAVNASEQDEFQSNTENDLLNSDGEYYEYPAMDADGNITMIKVPEVDPQELEQEKMESADSFDVVLTFGNEETTIASFDNYEDAAASVNRRRMLRTAGGTKVVAKTDYSKIKYGVVDFHTKPSNQNTTYTETLTGYTGYINGSTGADAAFLGYCSTDKSKIKFRMAGVEGCVNAGEVIVRDYGDDVYVGFYRVENGIIRHYIHVDLTSPYYSSAINVGLKPDYMKSNVVYFSYDGHYFYTSYEKMIDDYKKNTYEHSINPDAPYYNYFQFLSHRSKTDFTAQQLDNYTKGMVDFDSKMLNLGSAFISNQNKYGANALLMYGVAANESAWGTSKIANEKNNIFGHNATDYNPGGNANKYNTPADSVAHHARDFISDGYLDPKDYSGRYYGGHLGDKGSGMNVKYASDPYWGEKAAAIANIVSQKNNKKDYGKYQIGIVEKMTNLQIRKDANSSSVALYNTKNIGNYPVLIKEKVTGQSINNNNVWYKIQSDPTLNNDRTSSTQGTYVYDFNKMYGYVSGEYVKLLPYNNGNSNNSGTSGGTAPKPEQPEETYKPGDVNGDNKISSMDYVLIKNHILKISTLKGSSAKAADVNKDGKISSMDYVMIKNHILGIQLLN